MPVKTHAIVNITAQDLFMRNPKNASCLYDSLGYGYFEMVAKTKGVLFSIQANKAFGLARCGQAIKDSLVIQHDFPLSKPAGKVDPGTIASKVDSALVPFTYQAAQNSVHLDNAGQANSVIEISYCEPVTRISWALTGFTGTPSQTSVGLRWLTAEYATSGKVLWGTSANDLVNEVDEAGKATSHAVTVSGLTPNTVYYFQAVSSDEFGQVKSSDVLSFRTQPDWSITAVSSQAARTTAGIRWSTAEYATKGHVQWGFSATALNSQSPDGSVANDHQVALSGLAPNTTHYFKCVSSDEFGLVKSSDVFSFTTQPDWGITGFAGQGTRATVALEWDTSDQATVGQVLWGTSAASLTNLVNEGAAAANHHAVLVTGLSADTDYYFQAVATDGDGQQKSSNVVLVHTAVDWNITGFAGSSTQTSVSVGWATPGYDTNGRVFWGATETSLTNVVADTVTSQSHSASVSGLNADTIYYFQAASTDSDGIEKRSEVVAIRTQPVPLPTWDITGFAGTATKDTATLTWNTSQYSTSGKILWGSSPTAITNEVPEGGAGTAHSVAVNGLTPDTIYYFQAVSTDDRGQVKSSDVIPVRTMADVVVIPPVSWVISGFDGTSTSTVVNLIWQTTGAQTKATVNVGLSPDDLTLESVAVDNYAESHVIAVSGLTPDTPYYFQVVASDNAGHTVVSAVITKRTKLP
jgi:hypothetical protein